MTLALFPLKQTSRWNFKAPVDSSARGQAVKNFFWKLYTQRAAEETFKSDIWLDIVEETFQLNENLSYTQMVMLLNMAVTLGVPLEYYLNQ